MKLIRQADGSLALEEQQDKTLRDAAKQQGKPLPTTPQGAMDITGNADQAKMQGTQAQREATQQEQTLAGAKRLQQPRQKATEVELGVTSLEDRLGRLRATTDRVDQLTSERIQNIQMQQAGLALEDAALAPYSTEQQAAIRQYYEGPSEENLQALSRAMGQIIDPTQFSQDLGLTIAEFGQEAYGGAKPTVEELGLVSTELAQDLGVDEATLAAMDIDQLQESMRQLEADEFSRVEALRAEYLSATPSRREQIMAELKDLGQVGITGVEQSVDKLNAQLNAAENVQFAGQEYTLDQLLENEAISNAIFTAVSLPEALEALKETEPGLAAWVEQNLTDLKNIQKDMELETDEFRDTQERFTEETSRTSKEVLTALIGPTDFVTKAEMDQYMNDLSQNGLWQALGEDKDINEIVTASPEWANELKDMSYEDIKKAKTASDNIKSDDVLQDILGVGEGLDPFILDDNLMEQYDNTQTIISNVPKNADVRPLVPLIKSGEIGVEEAALIGGDQKKYDRLVSNLKDRKALDGAESIDDLTQHFFGLSYEDLSKRYSNLQVSNKYGVNTAEYETLKNLDALDGTVDGKISQNALANKIGALLGTNKDMSSVIKQGLNTDGWEESVSKHLNAGVSLDPNIADADALMKDNSLTGSEWGAASKEAKELLKKAYPEKAAVAEKNYIRQQQELAFNELIQINDPFIKLKRAGNNIEVGRVKTKADLEALSGSMGIIESRIRGQAGLTESKKNELIKNLRAEVNKEKNWFNNFWTNQARAQKQRQTEIDQLKKKIRYFWLDPGDDVHGVQRVANKKRLKKLEKDFNYWGPRISEAGW